MAETMWRAAKGEGVGNVFLEQVPVPILLANSAD